MKFSVRSSVARLAVLAAAMLCVMATGSPLDQLDGGRQHHLRMLEETDAPSAAPTPAAVGDRALEFTPVPTAATAAPTSMTGAPATDASGASSWRSSASVASALVLVGSVAAAAVVV